MDNDQDLPVTVLLLRSPVPTSQGTDPYHDAFGSFCLPSFATSALESGFSSPLPTLFARTLSHSSAADPSTLDLIKGALVSSASGKRKGKFIQDQLTLMTHHLGYPTNEDDQPVEIEYCVTSAPILSHTLLHTEQLTDRIINGYPSKNGKRIPYRGVIITSQRAVEAYTECSVKAQETLKARGRSFSSSPTQWNRIPFFAVGPATSSSLLSLPLAPWPRPRLVMGGEATATGEALARYVIRHFSSPSLVNPNQPKHASNPTESVPVPSTNSTATLPPPPPPLEPQPLLYLVGDKNAPTIFNMLTQASPPVGPISVEQIQVYETCPDPNFIQSCQELAKTLPTVVSTPISRRPSHGSLFSRPSSRRPSSVASQNERPPSAFANNPQTYPRRLSNAAEPDQACPKDAKRTYPAALAMTETCETNRALQAKGGSPLLSPSSATLDPEPIHPFEEESLLKVLRTKAKAQQAAETSTPQTVPTRISAARPDWIVFFSPSGVSYALDEFRKRKWLPPPPTSAPSKPIFSSEFNFAATPSANQDGIPKPGSTPSASHTDTQSSAKESAAASQPATEAAKTNSHAYNRFPHFYPKIAVIGPTTRQWMVEHLGIEPDVVASKPGPKELKEAIEAVELKLRSASLSCSLPASTSN